MRRKEKLNITLRPRRHPPYFHSESLHLLHRIAPTADDNYTDQNATYSSSSSRPHIPSMQLRMPRRQLELKERVPCTFTPVQRNKFPPPLHAIQTMRVPYKRTWMASFVVWDSDSPKLQAKRRAETNGREQYFRSGFSSGRWPSIGRTQSELTPVMIRIKIYAEKFGRGASRLLLLYKIENMRTLRTMAPMVVRVAETRP